MVKHKRKMKIRKRKPCLHKAGPPKEIPKPPERKLPPIHFYNAYIQKDGLPPVYIGMSEASGPTVARQRILKEWRSQPHVIEEIKRGAARLILRRLGIQKGIGIQ